MQIGNTKLEKVWREPQTLVWRAEGANGCWGPQGGCCSQCHSLSSNLQLTNFPLHFNKALWSLQQQWEVNAPTLINAHVQRRHSPGVASLSLLISLTWYISGSCALGWDSLIKHLLSYSRSHPKDHTWLTALRAAVWGNARIKGMNESVWMCERTCCEACNCMCVVCCVRVRLGEQRRCVSLPFGLELFQSAAEDKSSLHNCSGCTFREANTEDEIAK